MAYDSIVGKVVLFGGLWVRPDQCLSAGNDTGLFDPQMNTWTQVTPGHSPPVRWFASMTYDSTAQKVVLFGGHRLVCRSGIPEDIGPRLNDTWMYDARTNTWTEVATPNAPAARSHAGFAFDGREGRTVLFGGIQVRSWGWEQVDQVFGDTWEFDAKTRSWGHYDPIERPSGRHMQGMAFAPNVTILYGGCSAWQCWDASASGYGAWRRDTWGYDMQTRVWTNLTLNPGPPFGPGLAFAFDPAGVVVAAGKGETWEYRAMTTTPLPPLFAEPSATEPSAAMYAVIALVAAVSSVSIWWLSRVQRRRRGH